MQHSCMEGAFRPWPGALAESRSQSGDCIETEGPDCQVFARPETDALRLVLTALLSLGPPLHIVDSPDSL